MSDAPCASDPASAVGASSLSLGWVGVGVNLTDERTRSYSAFKERLLHLEDSGRHITAGVRARF
ncbi:hypothetical protein [Steroidobacter gossypii]|uniref:hypothetical protein n=1 Tax=Steroidobacter gossypii TaxID=2805490 RepID=UPI001C3FB05A|nr:hypothetical protein [Steroidobacter gossypii]